MIKTGKPQPVSGGTAVVPHGWGSHSHCGGVSKPVYGFAHHETEKPGTNLPLPIRDLGLSGSLA